MKNIDRHTAGTRPTGTGPTQWPPLQELLYAAAAALSPYLLAGLLLLLELRG